MFLKNNNWVSKIVFKSANTFLHTTNLEQNQEPKKDQTKKLALMLNTTSDHD